MGADTTRRCDMSSLSLSNRRYVTVNARIRLSIQVVFIFTNPEIVVVTSPVPSFPVSRTLVLLKLLAIT